MRENARSRHRQTNINYFVSQATIRPDITPVRKYGCHINWFETRTSEDADPGLWALGVAALGVGAECVWEAKSALRLAVGDLWC